MIEKIHKLIEEAEAFSTQSLEELELFRIKFLGKKGLLNDLFASFKEVPNKQKNTPAAIESAVAEIFKELDLNNK